MADASDVGVAAVTNEDIFTSGADGGIVDGVGADHALEEVFTILILWNTFINGFFNFILTYFQLLLYLI